MTPKLHGDNCVNCPYNKRVIGECIQMSKQEKSDEVKQCEKCLGLKAFNNVQSQLLQIKEEKECVNISSSVG